MAKSYRIRDEETEQLKEVKFRMIIETKADIKDSDLLHLLIRKYLKNLTAKDVLKYREEILKKED